MYMCVCDKRWRLNEENKKMGLGNMSVAIIAIREARSNRAIKTTWKVFPKGESLKQQRRRWWGPLVNMECVSSLGPSDLLKAHNPAMIEKFVGSHLVLSSDA